MTAASFPGNGQPHRGEKPRILRPPAQPPLPFPEPVPFSNPVGPAGRILREPSGAKGAPTASPPPVPPADYPEANPDGILRHPPAARSRSERLASRLAIISGFLRQGFPPEMIARAARQNWGISRSTALGYVRRAQRRFQQAPHEPRPVPSASLALRQLLIRWGMRDPKAQVPAKPADRVRWLVLGVVDLLLRELEEGWPEKRDSSS